MKRGKNGVEQHEHAVLAEISEIDTLAALNARQGSTLQSTLRQAYMGEQFGFGYADPVKRLVVAAHAYRLGMIVGVQPKRAGGLLDDVDGGTPQRFLWLPSEDPDLPDVAPTAPAPQMWVVPEWPAMTGDGRRRLPVCETARVAVDVARLARLRGRQDALDGHALLTRLKVGAALALLDGRAEVGEQDWELAGDVMDVSNRTRARVEAELTTAKRVSNEARGAADGDRAVIVDKKMHASKTKKLARNVLTRIRSSAGDGLTWSEIRRNVSSAQRDKLDEALALLIEQERITVEITAQLDTGGGGPGRRYRATRGDPS